MIRRFTTALGIVTAGLALAIAVPASASAHSWKRYHQPKQPNVVQTAIAANQQTGEFSTLLAAVTCTNLDNRLSNEHRWFTIFAPTDTAFAKAGLNAGNICTAVDKHTLRDILKYHITWGGLTADKVLAADGFWMLNYEFADINGATIDGQNIVKTDIMASNGVIHVIDGVMMP